MTWSKQDRWNLENNKAKITITTTKPGVLVVEGVSLIFQIYSKKFTVIFMISFQPFYGAKN